MPASNGPRSRRMIRGTIARIGDLAMRYGHASQLATLDCTSSRRSTVMCALPWATAVTTVYQRDSSSKRPRSSVVFAARAPDTAEIARVRHGVQGCAPYGRRLRRPWTPRLTRAEGSYCRQACAWRQRAKTRGDICGLTKVIPYQARFRDRGALSVKSLGAPRAPWTNSVCKRALLDSWRGNGLIVHSWIYASTPPQSAQPDS